MLLTPHTLVGITIAASVSNPVVSVPLSIAFHFFGDRVPHWDFFSHTEVEERTEKWRIFAVMLDIVVGVAVALTFVYFALWQLNNPALAFNMFLCGLGSVL